MKHINLKEVFLNKEEEEMIKDYVVKLGYIIEFSPKEFEGKYPVIRNKDKSRKGYIQKYKGDIWYIYGTKRENLSLSYELLIGFEKYYNKAKGNLKKLFRFSFGIIDFEILNK